MESENRKPVARKFEQSISTELEGDGFWKCTATLVDSVLFDGESEWITEEISAMSMDRDPQNAIETAMSANLRYMTQIVYQGGFNGLVEYKEFERRLEKSKNASVEA